MPEGQGNRITEVIEPEEENEDVLDLTEEAEDQGDEGDDEPREETFVQIGDEEPDPVEQAPDWVKELRRTNREQARRIKELEAGNDNVAKPKLGAKPTMESCDYDTAEYERQTDAWYDAKREYDAAEREAETKKKKAEESWLAKLAKLEADKAALGLDDLEDLEETVRETLNLTQQGIIVQGATNAALVFAALGRNPTKMREIAAIDDPVEYAFAIARLETTLKTGRRQVPAPEGTVKVRTKGGNATDNTLEKLRAEAERTSDYSKVHAYKRQQRAAAE